MHYYTCVLASEMSFSQVFKKIGEFVSDPEDRWRECVRVKRGHSDTSLKGGMFKDQIYLRGAVKILKNRATIDFLSLHSGKITIKDAAMLKTKQLINYEGLKYPTFLKDPIVHQKVLDSIAETNFIN